MKKRSDNWLVPEGFDSHWLSSIDPMLSPHTASEEDGAAIESVRLMHSILSRVSESKSGMGVTELSEALETSKARISRQMNALAQLGFLERNERTRKYTLGATIVAWGLRGLRFRGIDDRIETALYKLRETSGGKAVIFSIMEKRWGRVCFSLRSTSGDPLYIPMGAPLIFPRSPCARILWAFDPNTEGLLRSARSNGFIEHTSFDSVADLNQCLEDTRNARVAATYDVRMNNRGSAAAPVFDENDELLGAISIVEFSNKMRYSELEKLTTQVKIAAKELSNEFGSSFWQ